MADKSLCSNCGNVLKDQWLVCKFCHQARWKRITPYYVWGISFLVFAWWSFTQKVFPFKGSDSFINLFLPVIGAILGIIGAVMLLMACIATLRGLSVRTVTAAPLTGSASDWHTTAPGSSVGAGAGNLNAPAIKPPIPETVPLIRSAGSELDKQKVQTIHCLKCKHENAPGAKKCNQCGTNLLPGTGIGQRFGVFGCSTILVVISFVVAFLFFRYKPGFGGKDWIYLAGLIFFGVLMFGFGIIWSLSKTPLYEQYATRAKRHTSLNPLQAIADYGSAIDIAPPTQAFNYLLERADFYRGLGMLLEARTDLQHALENINGRMAKSKAPVIDLIKQRAEIYKYLGMEDEYAMEMLLYTIEKEKTFKFKQNDIAMGMEEGFKKGTEDSKRNELQQVRGEIMKNRKYGIVGQCRKCHSIVDLDHKLVCTNNPKHLKITNIIPALRKMEIS
jgi:ribosomal protein L40E